MKNSLYMFLLILILFRINASAQSPAGFSYQSVIRDNIGEPLENEAVELRFSLLPGETPLSLAWQEVHQTQTDNFGICNVIVGQGEKVNGTADEFSNINFAEAQYWIVIELKVDGNFEEVSKQQLLSVPYAAVAYQLHPSASPIPAGTIVAYGGKSIPAGWLPCNGEVLDVGEFQNLFAAINYNWGGAGQQFQLPDLQGYFLRGVDPIGSVDPDADSRIANGLGEVNEVGSKQEDAYRKHAHTMGNGGTDSHQMTQGGAAQRLAHFNDDIFNAGAPKSTHESGNSEETRPKNAYVYYIIKY